MTIAAQFVYFFILDSNYATLPYIYLHKNSYLKNKHLFINNFQEVLGKNSEHSPEKIMYIIEGIDVLDYKSFLCYIYFNAKIKFNRQLKINQMVVNISNVELKSTDNKTFSFINIKDSFMSIYNTFKSFVSELKNLVSDLEFLNSY